MSLRAPSSRIRTIALTGAALVAVLFFGLWLQSSFAAWTDPSLAPPSGNLLPPVRLGPSSAQTDATGNPSIFINDTGGGNLAQLRALGTDRLIVDGSGNVNISGQYRQAGTPGITVTCGAGQYLENIDTAGGIVTAGTCTTPSAGTGTQHILVRKTAGTTRNGTGLLNDPHLTFSIAANEVWFFEAALFVNNATSDDIKIAFTVPSGANLRWGAHGLVTGVTGVTGNANTPTQTTSGASANFGTAGTADVLITVSGIVENSTTAGNLTLQWAELADTDINGATLRINSWLRGEKL